VFLAREGFARSSNPSDTTPPMVTLKEPVSGRISTP